MTSCNRLSQAFILSIVALATFVVPAPLFAQGQNCPAGAELTDPNVAMELSAFNSGLNQRWPSAAAQKIDPLTNLPSYQTTEGCDALGITACAATIVNPTCEHITFNAQLDQMTGLSKLSFMPMSVQNFNPKEIAQHTQKGPDASKITDGVYAAAGHDATDPAYAIVLTHTPNNPGHALEVDLGAVVDVCGNAYNCKNGPQLQADNDDVYQLDYSNDGQTWTKYGQFPSVSGSGLHTRGIATITSGQNNPSFSGRYLRVFAVSGGNTFSVSELTLYNTSSQPISIGKPAIGFRPYQITDGILAQAGTEWNDPQYAAVLRTVGVASALVIDLGGLVNICGDSSCGPTVQADRHPFQIDYSPDGINWVPYSQVPEVSGSGLTTRTPSQIAAQAKVTSFTARYVRLYGLPADDDNYSISEVELHTTTSGNPIVSTGKLTYGPEPWETDGEVAPEGADWNDPNYANVLGACGQSSATVCPQGSQTGLTEALQIDLSQAFSLEALEVQADHHQFQIDYRASPTDPWQALWTVPSVSGNGLLTRPRQSLAGEQARYLMVYGTAGSDDNYSVSSVKVYTPIAKTPCAYASFADAAQQAAACSYDGTMTTGIMGPGGVIATSFTILSADAYYYCTGASSTHIPVVDGSIIGGTTCSGNLMAQPFPGQFCSATCADGTTPASALTFAGIAADPTDPSKLGPAFTLTDLNCDHSTGNLTGAVSELAAGTASNAVGSFLVGLSVSPLTTPSGQTLPPLIPSGKCQAASPPTANTDLRGVATHVGTASEAGQVSLSGTVSAPGAPPSDTLALDRDSAYADDGRTSAMGSLAQVRAKLFQAFPNREIRDLQLSPASGWAMFQLGDDTVMYVDLQGNYLFTGAMVELQNGRNLTQEFVIAKRRDLLQSISLEQAIMYTPAVQLDPPIRPLLLFDDPDCPYCRQFHPEVKKLVEAGIPVAVFLYPVAQLHPDAVRKSIAIWCADNQADVLDRALAGQAVTEESQPCRHPIEKNLELAKRLGLSGTPSLIFPDGHVATGYRSANEVLRMIRAPER